MLSPFASHNFNQKKCKNNRCRQAPSPHIVTMPHLYNPTYAADADALVFTSRDMAITADEDLLMMTVMMKVMANITI
jgi:hypothetical protein